MPLALSYSAAHLLIIGYTNVDPAAFRRSIAGLATGPLPPVGVGAAGPPQPAIKVSSENERSRWIWRFIDELPVGTPSTPLKIANLGFGVREGMKNSGRFSVIHRRGYLAILLVCSGDPWRNPRR